MKWFPSPHSGILFLLAILAVAVLFAIIVSVPSFGDSFFIRRMKISSVIGKLSFRPLIRGFFFYVYHGSGYPETVSRFRPLIRGFFFYGGEE